MQGLIFYSLLVGLAVAGPFLTTYESQDFTPDYGDTNAGQLFDRDLVNHEGEFAFPDLEDEDSSDFDGNVELEGADDYSVEGDVGVGSFKFIPGGVKLFSEGSGLPEEEERAQRWPQELELEYDPELPVRTGEHTELSERTNDESADVAPRRTGVGENWPEFPEQHEERAWYGDIVALKTRIAEADRMSAESTSD
ncbi:hypothetical protein ANANG_G00215710 [Anguilla anguilla]|uniref:Uncharacterized protein n=1 Tax=Anguilla anguilla TaxID=7936 RepID=A0A9D3LXP7_ANGAN|nr:hypothetical protein ANANG_G00215710 [Anguilla anguilla]